MSSDETRASRRDFLKGAASAGLAGLPATSHPRFMEPSPRFLSILRPPDLIRVFGPKDEIPLAKAANDHWEGGGAEVLLDIRENHVGLALRSKGSVSRIHCRWRGDLRGIRRFLGDHWERSYADLEWRGEAPNRIMPWYFMAHDGKRTDGYGVRTGPGAFCFWMADAEGISLWCDVRNGGEPVELGDRTLTVADIVCREGVEGESAFQATQASAAKCARTQDCRTAPFTAPTTGTTPTGTTAPSSSRPSAA